MLSLTSTVITLVTMEFNCIINFEIAIEIIKNLYKRVHDIMMNSYVGA